MFYDHACKNNFLGSQPPVNAGFGFRDMTRFPNQNKLTLFMFKTLFHFSVISQLTTETSASTPISLRLPVILLLKSNHIPTPEEPIYG